MNELNAKQTTTILIKYTLHKSNKQKYLYKNFIFLKSANNEAYIN